MKRKLMLSSLLGFSILLALAPTALASTTWYVNGVNGSDSDNCVTPATACRTIGHAISLAASGDTVVVAAATYQENLTIGFSLKIIGAGANTTIIDGGGPVVRISNASARVTLSNVSILNGHVFGLGGGVYNVGFLTINNSTISGNSAHIGGGIDNYGTLTISNSTVSGNSANVFCILPTACAYAYGGGISNSGGTVTITNSTISGNSARGGYGGGISNGTLVTGGTVSINNSTISQNSATCKFIVNHCYAGFGGGVWSAGSTTFQNSIVANNSGIGNCNGSMTSLGYNLSSDNTCEFTYVAHDLLDTNPLLGPLQYNGGPTQTMALLPGSPATDAGNPGGCTDSQGNVLNTDQRGQPRPDSEDNTGCDIGAYERQSD